MTIERGQYIIAPTKRVENEHWSLLIGGRLISTASSIT